MAGKPWERYAAPTPEAPPETPPAGPWERYAREVRRREITHTAPPPSGTSGLEAMGYGAAKATTLSGADEMAGGAAAMLPGAGLSPLGVAARMFGGAVADPEAYAGGRDAYRETEAAAATEEPGAFLAGQLGAGLGAGAAAAPLAGGALVGGLGQQALRMGLTGAAGGAAGGAAEGFLSGEGGLGPRLESAVGGGIAGAGAGAAVGAAAPLIGRGLQRGIEWWRSARRPGAIPPTETALANAAKGMDPAEMRAAAARPDAMAVDAVPAWRGVLDTQMQTSGRALNLARGAIEGREGRAAEQFTRSLDAAMGRPVGVSTTERGIREASANARREAYDTAYAQPLEYYGLSEGGEWGADPLLRNLDFLRQDAPGTVGYAMRMMRADALLDGVPIRPDPLVRVLDDGTEEILRVPDLREWDYIRRALSDAVRAEDGKGAMGGTTAWGRQIGRLERQIRDTLVERVPEYGRALQTAADPISQRRMLLTGRELFSTRTTREDLRDALEGATGPERAAMTQGARVAIDEIMANTRSAISRASNDDATRAALEGLRAIRTPANQEKLRLLLGDDEANKLFEQIGMMDRVIELRGGVATNSRTFGRGVTADTQRELLRDTPVATARRGEPIGLGKRIWQGIFRGTSADQQERYEALAEDITQRLLSQGADAQQTIERVISVMEGRGIPIDREAARALALRITGGAAVPAYQEGRTQIESSLPPRSR